MKPHEHTVNQTQTSFPTTRCFSHLPGPVRLYRVKPNAYFFAHAKAGVRMLLVKDVVPPMTSLLLTRSTVEASLPGWWHEEIPPARTDGPLMEVVRWSLMYETSSW